jgi:excisionase family DNA binding protein
MSATNPADRVRALALELVDALIAIADAQNGPPEPDRVYTLAEVADHLDLSRAGLQRLRRRGELHTIRVGRRRLVSSSELARFMQENEL